MRGVERERERVCVWVGGVRMGEGWRTGHICKSCERNDYKTGGAPRHLVPLCNHVQWSA